MLKVDSIVYDDIRLVRQTFDATVFPFLVNFRDELLENAETPAAATVIKLKTAVRSGAHLLHLLDEIEELRVQLDRISVSVTERDRLQDFYQALGTWQHDLPTRREYPQAPVCYTKLQTDSYFVKGGKSLKRARISIKTAFHSLKMGGRKALGKPVNEFPAELQQIRWVRVSRSLSVELLERIAVISHEDFACFSKIAANLNHACDYGSSRVKLDQLVQSAEHLQRAIHTLRAMNPERITALCDEVFEQIVPMVVFMGTFQESRHHFDTKVLDSRDSKAIKSIKKLKSDWRKDCRTRLSQLQIDIGLHRFNELAHNEITLFQDQIHSRLDAILKQTASTSQFLNELVLSYKGEEASGVRTTAFKARLETSKLQINRHLEDEFSKHILGVIDSLDLSTSMETVLSNTLLKDELLPDHSYVFDKKPQDPINPLTSFETLNFRDELTTLIKNDLFRKLRKIPVELMSHLEKIRTDIDQVIQIASLNLVLAMELVQDQENREDDAKILELIHSGVERAAKRVGELAEKIEQLTQISKNQTDELFSAYLDVSRNTMLDDNYLFIKSKNLEARLVSRSLDWKSLIQTPR